MHIAVIGAGGVGGYFGGRLAHAGFDVTFVVRPQTAAAMTSRGLEVESIAGDFHVHPRVATNPNDVGMVDFVLVAVKAWQVTAVAPTIRPLVGNSTCIVPLQNGVEAADDLAEVLGRASVLGGLCRISSVLLEPGRVRHTAIEPHITFGELGGGPCARGEPLLDALCRAGVQAEISQEISTAVWRKFLFIAAWSGVGAASRAPIGIIRATPATRELLAAAMREIAAVATAKGVQLPSDAVQQAMAFIDVAPPETTASMQRDLAAGRPSELEHQTGSVVRMGKQLGVATPLNAFLYACLLPAETIAREVSQ